VNEPRSQGRPPLVSDEGATTPGSRARDPLSSVEAQFARELFERHQLSLYRYLSGLLHSREEAKEILQETYLRLIRQPDFDRLRENARAYLFTTATNLARDLFRLKSSRGMEVERELYSAGGLDSPHWESWPDLALEGKQAELAILQALRNMEPVVKSALLLHRFRDMTHEQIGALLGVSERTVKRYVREGLTAIADQLKGER
jgi:RNA polymerase sigma factor (sigma-70 family)